MKIADFGEAKRFNTESFNELLMYYSKMNTKEVDKLSVRSKPISIGNQSKATSENSFFD